MNHEWVEFKTGFKLSRRLPQMPPAKPLSRWQRLLIFLRLKRRPLTPEELSAKLGEQMNRTIEETRQKLFETGSL